MEKVWNKYKRVFLLLINAFPTFAVYTVFFFLGAGVDVVLFLPILTALTALNYLNCNKVFSYILYQMFMLACIIGASCISVWLYYYFIGHDDGTLLVGALFVEMKAIIIIVTTIITTVVKAIKNKKARADG